MKMRIIIHIGDREKEKGDIGDEVTWGEKGKDGE